MYRVHKHTEFSWGRVILGEMSLKAPLGSDNAKCQSPHRAVRRYAECVDECNLNTQEAGQCFKFKADLGYIVNFRAAWAKVETSKQVNKPLNKTK